MFDMGLSKNRIPQNPTLESIFIDITFWAFIPFLDPPRFKYWLYIPILIPPTGCFFQSIFLLVKPHFWLSIDSRGTPSVDVLRPQVPVSLAHQNAPSAVVMLQPYGSRGACLGPPTELHRVWWDSSVATGFFHQGCAIWELSSQGKPLWRVEG